MRCGKRWVARDRLFARAGRRLLSSNGTRMRFSSNLRAIVKSICSPAMQRTTKRLRIVCPRRAKSLIGCTNSIHRISKLRSVRVRERVNAGIPICMSCYASTISRLALRSSDTSALHRFLQPSSRRRRSLDSRASRSTRGRLCDFAKSRSLGPSSSPSASGRRELATSGTSRRPGYKVQWVPLYVWRDQGFGRGLPCQRTSLKGMSSRGTGCFYGSSGSVRAGLADKHVTRGRPGS